MNTSELIVVAVTGVGAIIGQGIVRSLRASNHVIRVVGIDLNSQSPAPYMVDVFEQKPNISEDSVEYLDFWQSIIHRHGIQLVMPGLDVDMLFLDKKRAWFQLKGVRLALNSSELILSTANKWDFGNRLSEIGYPVIPSGRPTTWGEAVDKLGLPPMLLKPLYGNGSRGIVKLEDEQDFEYWRKKAVGEWMLQRIVGNVDEEYTVGLFGLGEGDYIEPLIFRRRLSNAGNTQEAEVIPNHPILELAVKTLCKHFCPIGPTNMQFRVEGEIPYLLEINPRFSSSNSLRTAFGYNEAKMAIDYYIHEKKPELPATRNGIGWRYSEDFIIYASDSV
jgi:carbamoyl-phosphate synthase large subunit